MLAHPGSFSKSLEVAVVGKSLLGRTRDLLSGVEDLDLSQRCALDVRRFTRASLRDPFHCLVFRDKKTNHNGTV
jgi:hypothetical protein